MNTQQLVISLIMLISIGSTTFSQELKKQPLASEDALIQPPIIYTQETIREWVEAARNRIKPNLPVRIMQTADWSNYVNFNHFVPRTADPHGGDEINNKLYDFNWHADDYAKQGLPTAEVIETGEFLFWWNRCNFKKMSEESCKWLIDVVVAHEGRHYDQWRAIALDVLESLNSTLVDEQKNSRMPINITDLEKVPGAKVAFLSVWNDVAHYQCRETEDYSQQIINGEIPTMFLEERVPYLDWYADKCDKSKWRDQFSMHIHRARLIHQWWYSEHKIDDTSVNK